MKFSVEFCLKQKQAAQMPPVKELLKCKKT